MSPPIRRGCSSGVPESGWMMMHLHHDRGITAPWSASACSNDIRYYYVPAGSFEYRPLALDIFLPKRGIAFVNESRSLIPRCVFLDRNLDRLVKNSMYIWQLESWIYWLFIYCGLITLTRVLGYIVFYFIYYFRLYYIVFYFIYYFRLYYILFILFCPNLRIFWRIG